jgi:hypothetical protein
MALSAKQGAQALRKLARVPSQVAAEVARKISEDIQGNFDAGVDAYKKPWKPLAPATLAKGRTPPPLTDTRKGRRSIKVAPLAGAGVGITVSDPKMGIHQAGAGGHPPRRSFLPTGVLPRKWAEIWKTAVVTAARKVLDG